MKEESGLHYEVAMVGLDLTEMDDHIIEYLSIILPALSLERIFFVHVAKELELPKEIAEKYPDLLAPLDENISDGIEHKVGDLCRKNKLDYDIIVHEGVPLEHFLRLSKIKNVDLIVLGRKRSLKGSGMLSGNVVRKSSSSILFVTETFKPVIKRVLVPVDFSKHSILSLKLARQLRERLGSEIYCSHIYHVPSGFHKTGKSYEEFAEIMKSHAAHDYEQFCRDHDFTDEMSCDYLLSDHQSKGKLIIEHAHEADMDLIVIGSRGRTRTSALLIGSIVEKLLTVDTDVPMWVLKNKRENLGFLEAFMKI
jgi:nucleotide-binding universal stress UspA family protein